MPMNIAVAGSEELISENLLELLQEKQFPVGKLFLLTALDAEDQDSIRFNNQTIYVQDLASFDWSQAELVFRRFSLYVLANTFIPPNNHDFASLRRCSFTRNHAK